MFRKIILCQSRNMEIAERENYLCSFFLVFKENVMNYAYGEIFECEGELYIETNSWSMLDEGMIAQIHMVVRNSLVKTSNLPKFEQAYNQVHQLVMSEMSEEEKYWYLADLAEFQKLSNNQWDEDEESEKPLAMLQGTIQV